MKIEQIKNSHLWDNPRKNIWFKIHKNGKQMYHEKKCAFCSDRFAASHSRVVACSRSCAAKQRLNGDKSHFWKGGKFTDKKGYINILKRDHPFATKPNYYIKEHRLVMEAKIGRYLNKGEIVHHINGIKHDNRPENLELLTQSDHMKYHNSERLSGKLR